MSINFEECKALCIEGNMTNGQLADHFGVDATEIYAFRSRHGLTINKCAAIRDGKIKPGNRTSEEIWVEIRKVMKVKSDAQKKVERAEARLGELRKELKEVKG